MMMMVTVSGLHNILWIVGRQSCGWRNVLDCNFWVRAHDEDVQAADDQVCNSGGPVQFSHGRILAKSKAKEGDEDEVQPLASQPVHEAKVSSQRLVDPRSRHPPHEFVREQQGGEHDHVRSEEGLADVLGRFSVVHFYQRQNSEPSHHHRQSEISERKGDQGPAALAALIVVRWRRGLDGAARFCLLRCRMRVRLRVQPPRFTVSCHADDEMNMCCCVQLLCDVVRCQYKRRR
mmetsp:Transcript_27722/g.77670  ORF Transcript_27722/g.77670 Transcript_27722/m.77670 type:complete len:233 (-) Transcript_27722:4-702(-)